LLELYDFVIKYWPGKQFLIDGPSRRPDYIQKSRESRKGKRFVYKLIPLLEVKLVKGA